MRSGRRKSMAMTTVYVIKKVNNPKFPYRLTIRRGEKTLLALMVQDRWPGQKGNIFCIREEGRKLEPPEEELERVPVLAIHRYGQRLSIVLDRAKNKRCDFLFLTKRYKTKEGEYEQIFWRTQKALTERKTRFKLTTYHLGTLNIVVDSAEKYAWRFPGAIIEKMQLPVGDYALKHKSGIIAVIERKTFDNLLAEFGRMAVFHQQLGELSTYKHAAVVIEANYSDFLNPTKLRFYKPSFAVKAIGEIYALHPGLTVFFAGNRKLANEWAHRFFEAVDAHEMDKPNEKVAEVVAEYGLPAASKGGTYMEMKEKIFSLLPREFTFLHVKGKFPHVSETRIRKVLGELEEEGVLKRQRRGRQNIWQVKGLN